MDRYSHVEVLDRVQAVEDLPAVPVGGAVAGNVETAAATGTDGKTGLDRLVLRLVPPLGKTVFPDRRAVAPVGNAEDEKRDVAPVTADRGNVNAGGTFGAELRAVALLDNEISEAGILAGQEGLAASALAAN